MLPGAQGSGAVMGGGAAVFGGNQEQKTAGGLIAGGKITLGAVPAEAPPPIDPEFQKWISREAVNVGSLNGGGSGKTEEMERIAKALTPSQAEQLLQTAVSDASPAAERILAVYLLGEGGAQTRSQLVRFVHTPLPDRGTAATHTMAETQHAADRARVLVAIEALAAQAKTDPAALQALQQAIAGIQDPNVKRLAQKYLDELRAH